MSDLYSEHEFMLRLRDFIRAATELEKWLGMLGLEAKINITIKAKTQQR